MTPLVWFLGTLLVLWMLACAFCGFRGRFWHFVAVLGAGLALNTMWMVFGLDAHPFEVHALIAHAAAILYASAAFGTGLLLGRLIRQIKASSVRDLSRDTGPDV